MTSAPPPAAPPPVPPFDPPSWPPPPPGPPVRPQLRRSRTDKILGGVSGGLAEYSGIDALLWRVGFVALTLAGGTGIIVYLLLWLLMPAGPRVAPGTAVEMQARPPAGPRSPVPGVTIAALLIAVGLLALVDSLFGWDVGPTAFFGTALLVVGLGLVAAAFASGRTARGALIALGVVLSLGTIAAASEPSEPWHGHEGHVGDQTFQAFTAEEVQPGYDCGVGDCTLDLSDVDVSSLDGRITTAVDAGMGDVQVILPRSADVEVTLHSGIGDVRLLDGMDSDGGYSPGLGSAPWTDDGEPEFVLTINTGMGDVEVSRG
jgi:phage shock protein PspC (stress-responsive transcriptional regulator)